MRKKQIIIDKPIGGFALRIASALAKGLISAERCSKAFDTICCNLAKAVAVQSPSAKYLLGIWQRGMS